MGKPAARIGDLTAHGGTVTLGKPTVMIGKMPAATLGDMHVCPMVTGVVPHVGGPITLGSTGVLIGKMPAARVSDITVCVGPPSMPAMGCFQVLIGEVGSGSQAGSAASAAAAAAASKNGPKAIQPFPLAEPPETPEVHWVECEVTDSAGLPLPGIRYKLTDPDGNIVVGTTTPEGKIRHDGYASEGSFKVVLPILSEAKWSKPEAKAGDEQTLTCKAEGFDEGLAASIMIVEERDSGRFRRMLAILPCKVSGEKVEAKWKLAKEDYPAAIPGRPAGEPTGGRAEYHFLVQVEGQVAYSGRATFSDDVKIKVMDDAGKPIAEAAYEMRLHDGTLRKGKADKDGKAEEKDVPLGPYVIILPEVVIAAGEPEEEKPIVGEPSLPEWIRIAQGELGQAETAGAAHNARILEYHASTRRKPKTDEVPWCSSFVNWVMTQAGYEGTSSSWAKDWATWGKKLDKPALHSIAVIDWGKNPDGSDKGGHVGFVMGKKKERMVLLGGNQGDSVSYSSFPKDKIIAYVVPETHANPEYELPEIKHAKGTSYAATR